MRNKASVFNNARNIDIKDTSLTVNTGNVSAAHPVSEKGLKLLFEEVALNAILNAGGRADEVRCYPGTRKEVIGKIETWMDGRSELDHRMLWLSGPAGAGKSAIAQTVAERGADRGVHAANFFFFHGDKTRNCAQPLVATLVYQLIDVYPTLVEHLTDCLTTKPLTPKASIEEQFLRLVASPIQNLRHSSPINQPIILIIDGLDECDDDVDQVKILSALYTLVSRYRFLFRVMVASRAEPHLVMFFNKIANAVESIFLNDEYRPRDDICKFVTAKFDEIKRTHYLAHMLIDAWPTQEDIDKITDKSSGQFIYAATVMRFIEYSRDSPALSLLTVHQIRPPSSHSPFAQLDALYSHIFSKARNIQVIQWTLYLHTTQIPIYWVRIMQLVGYEIDELRSFFADISSIAQIILDQAGFMVVDFYHASLPDYFTSASRSGIYHVDTTKIPEDLSIICLRRCRDTESFDIAIMVLKYVEVLTSTELSESLLATSKRRFGPRPAFTRPFYWIKFIETLIRLYLISNKALFKRMLRSWVRFGYIHKFDTTFHGSVDNKAVHRYYAQYRVTEWFIVALMRALNLV